MGRRQLVRFGFVGVLLGAGLYNVAQAQDETKPPAVTAARETQPMTLEQRLADGEAICAGMEPVARNVTQQLASAREKNDAVKILCLDDKLTQINIASKSANERLQSLRQAVTRQDAELAAHEHGILVVFKERVEQLSAEANQCIGEEAGFVGETKVTVDVDPNLPGDDPTAYPPDLSVVDPEPPRCTSCFK